MGNATPFIQSTGQATPVRQVTGVGMPLAEATSGNAWPVMFVTSGRAVPVVVIESSLLAETVAWRDAVIANGGTVSANRLFTVNQFITAEKAAGTWALTDDYWGLWAENAPQALTSLKQLRLASAVNSPTFTADRGYTFDGVSNYLNTGFIPNSHKVAMTSTNMRLGAYSRIGAALTTFAAGVTSGGDNSIRMVPRNAADQLRANLGSSTATFAIITDDRALVAISRTPAGVFETFQRGLSKGTVVPATTAGTLPAHVLYIAASNSAGVLSAPRAFQAGLVDIGASLSAVQEAAQYTNIQTWGATVGAAV